jgi:membrane-bound inhibitor of C-type lysozyme
MKRSVFPAKLGVCEPTGSARTDLGGVSTGYLPAIEEQWMQNMISRELNFPKAFGASPVLGHASGIRKALARLTLAALVLIVPASSAFAAEASYSCSNGTVVRAVFRGLGRTGSVQLTFPGHGRPMTIPQVPSADGGRYASGDTQFWIKGNTARLTRKGGTTECRTGPAS